MSKTKQTSAAKIYARLMRDVRPYAGIFLLSILGNFIYACSQAGFAELMRYFIEALEGGPVKYIVIVPIAGFVIAVVRGIGYFTGVFCIGVVGQNLVRDIRNKMFERLIHLPSAFYDHHSSGHLVSKVTYDANMVTQAATNAVTVIVREGLTVLVLFGYMFYTNWKLTLIFILIAPFLAAIVSWIGKRMRRLSTNIQDAMGGITQTTSEAVQGYQVVRTNGGESFEMSRFYEANGRNRIQQIKFELTRSLNSPVMQSIVAAALALVMYLVLNLRDEQSTSTLIAYVTAAALLPKSLRSLGDVYGQIQKGVAAAESVFSLIDEVGESDTGELSPARVGGRVSIEHLNFTYDGTDKPALNDVCLDIESGKTVALVGKSGSGKTTLAGLLMRFYEPDSGVIRLDGHPLSNYKLESLRRQISIVPQHVMLFNTTIGENIAYGDASEASQESIVSAAKAAHVHDFVAGLDLGYDTPVGENAVLLSGGQRQRLAIARAILRDTPILILDEATSALDNESEQHIQAAMKEVMVNRTTIVIAHRLSTIENADLIVVMDQGQVIEQGGHQELMAANGHYARLHARNFEED